MTTDKATRRAAQPCVARSGSWCLVAALRQPGKLAQNDFSRLDPDRDAVFYAWPAPFSEWGTP
jgi:hypothetical protein